MNGRENDPQPPSSARCWVSVAPWSRSLPCSSLPPSLPRLRLTTPSHDVGRPKPAEGEHLRLAADQTPANQSVNTEKCDSYLWRDFFSFLHTSCFCFCFFFNKRTAVAVNRVRECGVELSWQVWRRVLPGWNYGRLQWGTWWSWAPSIPTAVTQTLSSPTSGWVKSFMSWWLELGVCCPRPYRVERTCSCFKLRRRECSSAAQVVDCICAVIIVHECRLLQRKQGHLVDCFFSD